MLLTAPSLDAVLTTEKTEEAGTPNLTSLPSMLPPRLADAAFSAGVPPRSLHVVMKLPARNRNIMTPKIVQPWLCSRTIRPKVAVNPAGIARMSSISTKLESGVGFSRGCAELALKKPPPSELRSLIGSCEATGPSAIVCAAPSRVAAFCQGPKVCTTPCEHKNSAPMNESGSRT